MAAPLTSDQFETMTDEQLREHLPSWVRPAFPGKAFCPSMTFYLWDGEVYDFLTASVQQE